MTGTGGNMQGLEEHEPAQVGPYRLVKRLGAGGMGLVYLGVGGNGELVAVKVVHPGFAHDEQFRSRFAREVAVSRKVTGPWTAAVVDADPTARTPWLATEYVHGPSLEQAVRTTGPLPRDAVHVLAAGLARALVAIHAAGLIHRDIKPSNVLLAADGPRLIDFGISRAIDGTRMTSTGMIIGTPAFMSPEQAEGDDLGPESDVFSLGAVLVLAATGVGPFGDSTPLVTLRKIVTDEPDLGSLAEPVRGIVAACLLRDRNARPTATELAQRLQPVPEIRHAEWLPSAVTALIPPAPLASTRLDPGVTPTRVDPTPGAPPARRMRRRVVLAGAGALGLAAAGFGAVTVFGGSTPRRLWTFEANTDVTAVAFAAGTIYVAALAVSAIDPGTGQVNWTYRGEDAEQIAVSGDTVVVGSSPLNGVYGLGAATGDRLWSAPGDLLGVAQGHVITSGYGVIRRERALVGFDATTGEQQWARAIDVSDGSEYMQLSAVRPPGVPGLVSPGSLHLTTDQRLDTIDVATGAVRWSRPWQGSDEGGTITAVGDVLYVSEQAAELKCRVLALDAMSGAERWRKDADGLAGIAAADSDGIYLSAPLVNGGPGVVAAWDVSGNERWMWRNTEKVGSIGSDIYLQDFAAIPGGTVVVSFTGLHESTDSGMKTPHGLIRLADGEPQWRLDLDPVVDDSGKGPLGPVITDQAVLLGVGDTVHAVALE